MTKLLPQDIVHLRDIAWAGTEKEASVERVQKNIGRWLAEGILAFQSSQHRQEAFAPIGYLIGTSRESLSYIESLSGIASALENVSALEGKNVPMGTCFAEGSAVAVEKLTNLLIENDSLEEQNLQALLDALLLMRVLRPHSAGRTLCSVWSMFESGTSERYEDITQKHPWELEHALILASVYAGKEVREFLADLESESALLDNAPDIVVADYRAILAAT